MATVRLEAQVSSEELLRAVEQLGPEELERFVIRVLRLRADRGSSRATGTESALLSRINAGLPDDRRSRYDALAARRAARTLTPDEHAELIVLGDEIEAIQADRVAALAELARLRGVTLRALMVDLGIQPTATDG